MSFTFEGREITFTLKDFLYHLIDEIIAESFHFSESFLFNDELAADHGFSFRFSKSDLKVVRNHASILGIHGFLEKTRRNQTSYAAISKDDDLDVVSFLEDLEEVFKVPEVNHRPRNVELASFIGFLVQLLTGKPHLFAVDTYPVVITELMSFNTILLDSPFQSSTDENHSQVQILLSQFESLANKSGKSVYSFLFSPHPPPSVTIDEILAKPITHLKDNLILFFNSPSYINITPNTIQFAMSSIFIVDSFLYDLENLMDREDDSILEVKDHVRKLHQTLKDSWSLLNKQYDETDELKQIVMLAFEAEYLVNYFLCGDAPAWYLALRLPHIIHNVELVGSRLKEMVRENHDVGRLLQVGDDFGARLSLQTGINSGMDEIMVGFEDEELKILVDLVGGGAGLQIISIIGMPGLGKTTLAKKMYNHPTVRDRFDKISWCTVSQAYKTKKLLVEILLGLDSQVKEAALAEETEDAVGVRIHKTLTGRRYLIVVDDIWELRAWEGIMRYLPDDGNGSRILLTSRNKEVADHTNSNIHELPFLSHDQCWELLQMKVFHGESCPLELENTGVKIAAQCNGLPLVVVVIAGILSTMEKDLSAWENVSQTLHTYIHQDTDVAKSLELSYKYLPHHLKPCFLYFGRFREDEQIIVKEVVRLWIAEGFFITVDKRKRAEDMANEYLKELIGKNLIMVAKKNYKGEAIVCTMHDLLRDVCLKIAKDESFMTICEGDLNHRVQHIICYFGVYLASNGWLGWFLAYSKYIRSFVYYVEQFYLRVKVGHMKVLRVLEHPGDEEYNLEGLRIQNVVHLRYLKTRRITEPIGRFSSLEYLIIENELHISSSFLDAMMKLRYLRAGWVYVDDTDWNTSRTYNLEYISRLAISSQEAAQQQLKVFPHVRRLVCAINYEFEFIIFDSGLFIQLESLTIGPEDSSYWMLKEIRTGNLFPSTIIKLSLKQCTLSKEQMSMIGALPTLEVLKLLAVDITGDKWDTRDDEFQKLKYLKLESMMELVEWNVSSWEHFPVLRHLIIKNCSRLEEIPIEIGNISTLQLISATGLGTPQLKESVNMLKEQLQDEGNGDDVTIIEDLEEEDEEYQALFNRLAEIIFA